MRTKIKYNLGKSHMPMGAKLTIALLSIVAILFISSMISIMEFSKMSNFVSSRVQDDIESINTSSYLAIRCDLYNHKILSVVGAADTIRVTSFRAEDYTVPADSIMTVMEQMRLFGMDSLRVAYDNYISVSRQLDSVVRSDFTDSREWYFSELLPVFNKFQNTQTLVNDAIRSELFRNSQNFDDSFYRGIMPGVASIFAGILLVLLLLFFILTFYVRPLRRMLKSLDAYFHFSQPYAYIFEGDDELQELNRGITELVEENQSLKKRIRERER